MAKFSRFPLLLIFLMIQIPTPVMAQDEKLENPLDVQKLSKFIQNKGLKTIEEVIEQLPHQYKSHFILMHKSRSLQKASGKNPRAILFGPDSKFILSFNDKASSGGDVIEIMQYNQDEGKFELYEMKEDDIKGFTLSQKNPPKCLKCHSQDPKPNWDNYAFWEGAFGEVEEGGLRKHYPMNQFTYLEDFFGEDYALKHPRFGQLNLTGHGYNQIRFSEKQGKTDGLDEFQNVALATFQPNVFYRDMNSRNIDFTDQINYLNMDRISRLLEEKAPFLIPFFLGNFLGCFPTIQSKEYPKYIGNDNYWEPIRSKLIKKGKLTSEIQDSFLVELEGYLTEGLRQKYAKELASRKKQGKYQGKVTKEIKKMMKNWEEALNQLDEKEQSQLLEKAIDRYIHEEQVKDLQRKKALFQNINSFFPFPVLKDGDPLFDEMDDPSLARPTFSATSYGEGFRVSGLGFNASEAIFITVFKKIDIAPVLGIRIEDLFPNFSLNFSVDAPRKRPFDKRYGLNSPFTTEMKYIKASRFYTTQDGLYKDILDGKDVEASCQALKMLGNKLVLSLMESAQSDKSLPCHQSGQSPILQGPLLSLQKGILPISPPIPSLCLKCHAEKYPPTLSLEEFHQHLHADKGKWNKRLFLAVTATHFDHKLARAMPMKDADRIGPEEEEHYWKKEYRPFVDYLIHQMGQGDPAFQDLAETHAKASLELERSFLQSQILNQIKGDGAK